MASYEKNIEGKPKGRTIFESYWCGGFPCTENGIFVYYDGRVCSLSSNRVEDNHRSWELLAVCKPLVDDIKKLIKDNWETLKNTPECIYDGCPICDGGTQQFKFRGRYFYRDAVVEPQAQFIEALQLKVSRLLRKHHVFDPEYQRILENFVEDYCDQMDQISYEEINCEEREKGINDFIDGNFPDECSELGFQMDCGEGFNEKYGDSFFREEQSTLEDKFARVDDFLLLGDMIFSQWRYFNHWCDNPRECFDPFWFKLALTRLMELSEDEKNEND